MQPFKLSPTQLDIINQRLVDHYGKIDIEVPSDIANVKRQISKPCFRLVWSEDLKEKRWMTHTDKGVELLHPEMREVPKYCHYIQNKYIIEGLMSTPIITTEDDRIDQVTYEPLWVFEDKEGNFLPPNWTAIHFILESQRKAVESSNGYIKYRDPESTKEEAEEEKKKRIREIEMALYGNETETTDALAYKEGIVVPNSFERMN